MSQNTASLPHSEESMAERIEITLLKERFPETILEINEFRGDTRITVRREDIVDVCCFLRDDPRLQFNFFSECMGVDYLDHKPHRFEVVYNLYSLQYTRLDGAVVGRNQRIFIKVPVPEDDPVVPSVMEVYPGANWPEREIYDMFGVKFAGHPDLRRILMSDDWAGHPQRKDYPLGGEQVQFPEGTLGPAVGDLIVEHAGESFTGLTADEIGDPN